MRADRSIAATFGRPVRPLATWLVAAALVASGSRDLASQESDSTAATQQQSPTPTTPSDPSATPLPRIADSVPATDANDAEPLAKPGDGTSAPRLRLREGTHLKDRLGRFRQNGESLSFVDEDGRELGGLPNLNLERIIRMLKTVDEPESVWWSVSGAVTEFAGKNYLLISRAVYKAATLPPAPDSIQ